jgi:hypothetical protein
MKTLKILFLLCSIWLTSLGQVPQAVNYQAVVRDNAGAVLANKTVTFRISILEGSATGTVVYSELHSRTTNEFGLADLLIGKGSYPTGNFSEIVWGAALHFIKIELDPVGGIAFQEMGTSQIMSVPYALYALTAENVETGDNWGTQAVAADATLAGLGTVANPLGIANNAVNSARIADGTVALSDLARGSVNADKIVDGSVLSADLADHSVTPAKISSSGAAVNEVLQYNGTNVVWDLAPGTLVKYTVINTGCHAVASFPSSTYTKIVDLGTFTKEFAGSTMEITFEGRIWAQTMTGTGAHFELRVDNAATTNGRARANLRSSQAGGIGEYVSITGLFSGLRNGTHTVSMWISGAGGGGTNGGVDPGCWSDDHIIVREIR